MLGAVVKAAFWHRQRFAVVWLAALWRSVLRGCDRFCIPIICCYLALRERGGFHVAFLLRLEDRSFQRSVGSGVDAVRGIFVDRCSVSWYRFGYAVGDSVVNEYLRSISAANRDSTFNDFLCGGSLVNDFFLPRLCADQVVRYVRRPICLPLYRRKHASVKVVRVVHPIHRLVLAVPVNYSRRDRVYFEHIVCPIAQVELSYLVYFATIKPTSAVIVGDVDRIRRVPRFVNWCPARVFVHVHSSVDAVMCCANRVFFRRFCVQVPKCAQVVNRSVAVGVVRRVRVRVFVVIPNVRYRSKYVVIPRPAFGAVVRGANDHFSIKSLFNRLRDGVRVDLGFIGIEVVVAKVYYCALGVFVHFSRDVLCCLVVRLYPVGDLSGSIGRCQSCVEIKTLY